MKVRTFAENLFASVSLVQQEPVSGVPYKTADEEYEIKEGELVLLARYGKRVMNDTEEAFYAILAVAYRPFDKTFHTKRSNGLKILHPCFPVKHPFNSALPPSVTTRPIDGCEYLMTTSAVKNPDSKSEFRVDTYIVHKPSNLTGNRIYIGFENVMQFLLTTPGFEPHAGALAISWMKYKTI